jgi:transposase
MWVFTIEGFVSAVREPYDHTELIVRARDLKSLHTLEFVSGRKAWATPSNDYPYRIKVTNADFDRFLEIATEDISYDNFKMAVDANRGKTYAKALSKVWSAMHDVEDDKARGNWSTEELDADTKSKGE